MRIIGQPHRSPAPIPVVEENKQEGQNGMLLLVIYSMKNTKRNWVAGTNK